jgi:recombination protein U
VITKIPTPWKVQRKFSPYEKSYNIAYAFPEKKSTVDFGGTAKGKSIWFDVKVTTQKLSFPLKNIHAHQIEYLKKVNSQGGKAFFLIHSEILERSWLLWIDKLVFFLEKAESIPFEWLDANCSRIESSPGIMIDYLSEVLSQSEG